MLAAVAESGPWDAILSSPLSRCADFGRALARGLGIPFERDDRLREMHFGAWEGRSAAELMATEPEALTAFWRDPLAHPPPGAEALVQFRARTIAAFEAALEHYRGQRLLVIAHGGVIRVLLSRVLGRPLTPLLRMEVPHASLHRLRIPHGAEGGTAELLTASLL